MRRMKAISKTCRHPNLATGMSHDFPVPDMQASCKGYQ